MSLYLFRCSGRSEIPIKGSTHTWREAPAYDAADLDLAAVITLVAAGLFGVVSGFNDGGNLLAWFTSGRVVTPRTAAAQLLISLAGPLVIGTAIARTIGVNIVDLLGQGELGYVMIVLAPLSVVLLSWRAGIPTSMTPALDPVHPPFRSPWLLSQGRSTTRRSAGGHPGKSVSKRLHRSGSLTCHMGIHRLIASGHALWGISIYDPPPALGAIQAVDLFAGVHELAFLIDQDAVAAILDQLGQRPPSKRYEWRAGCEGLDEGQPEWLVPLDRNEKPDRVTDHAILALIIQLADPLDEGMSQQGLYLGLEIRPLLFG
jgi:hypothetical protein